MPKPIIAIDIDEVLIPYRPYFLDYHKQKYGLDMTPDEFHEYMNELSKDPEELDARVQEYIRAKDDVWRQPVPGALEAITKLKEKYELEVVTARARESVGGYQTSEEWVEERFPKVFNNVHFTKEIWAEEDKFQKWEICRKIGATCMIDDSLGMIVGCSEHGIRGLLFGDSPWNQAEELPANVTRVKDWDAVLEELL